MPEKIAIIGGTGKEGKGLAYRWTLAGHHVIIGSRVIEKARSACDTVQELLPAGFIVFAMENLDAARESEIIVLTVPFSVHREMLALIKGSALGKLVVDVTVPIVPPKVTRVQMPPDGSAGQEAVNILGEEVQVATAFQNISYERLLGEGDIDCDVLVCGTSKETRDRVIKLVQDAGLRGFDAGPMENSMIAEGLTSILIGINKQFNIQHAGIRITGIPGSD
ncbi:MAG: NADPH-dependent F420 reductase [Anaerolineaceae bacterium]